MARGPGAGAPAPPRARGAATGRGALSSGYAAAFWVAAGLLAAAALAAYVLLPGESRAAGGGPVASRTDAAEHEGDAAGR
ncbi:hypothetical protein [Streptomyces bacillaris]|uniref:hypothetical protein n=1 Tax=Streptomyces bacillaris TaxID=68179 RepID=UPI003F4D6DEC